ncbi:MAG TPA: DUF192 domain-containing protein [Acidimicrobiales bacterium]|nr:DUF192 domain-containing protein [Acidimicrobiales bacterium]
MAWLLKDDQVLAHVEIADSFGARLKGLIGRRDLEGAMLFRPAKSVHTIGMRFPIDVAYCDKHMRVLSTVTMRRLRVGRPRPKAHAVVEARAGAFERWGLQVGDTLEIR